jgi:serine/threonine protein kinase
MTTSSEGRRYRIVGVLGQGGFGTVYRAELLGEGGFKRQVALKVLNPDMEGVSGVAGRLRDEARLLGLLRHRAILQVDGLVRLDDRWTIVMEYIEGVDLAHLGKGGVVPAGPALEIVGEVASALHVAYTWPSEKGEPLRLLHRDLKPTNILLTSAGETKVLDFGIARAEFGGREAVTKSVLFGSPGYMAPERFDLEEGPAGDVYSLGVVLYEILSGTAFGKASTRPDKHQQLVDEQLAKLGSTPPDVKKLLARMLAYEPEHRPTAREVETACRELRSKVQGAWLRDWAEQTVPPLLVNRGVGGQHDFSDSILIERSGAAAGSETTGFDLPALPAKSGPQPPKSAPQQPAKMPSLALPTFDGAELSEEEPKPPPPPSKPAPPPTKAGGDARPTGPPPPPEPPAKKAATPPPVAAREKARSQLTALQRPPAEVPAPAAAKRPAQDSGMTLFVALGAVIGAPVVLSVVIWFLIVCCGFAGSV